MRLKSKKYFKKKIRFFRNEKIKKFIVFFELFFQKSYPHFFKDKYFYGFKFKRGMLWLKLMPRKRWIFK